MKFSSGKIGFFDSITFRVSSTLLIVIVIAELVAGAVWYFDNEEVKKNNANKIIHTMVDSVIETYQYFQLLPVNYRHLILNQLMDAGGSRFFISINNRYIPNENVTDLPLTNWLSDVAAASLREKLKSPSNIAVAVTQRESVRVFNSALQLDELPEIWTKYSLVLGELDLPILVIQIQLSPQEWFYIASVLPIPFSSLSTSFMEARQLVFLALTSLLLMLCTAWLLQREFRPIRALAKAATLMGTQLSVMAIDESGSRETRAAVHAFNKMNNRVKSYIRDREMLFSAISHDLKTPLAALKLRTEMLEDEAVKERFEKLLNEVEMMTNGALQCIRETDIHEDQIDIDIEELLMGCADHFNRQETFVELADDIANIPSYMGKPVAIKRCIYNVIENGVKYGRNVSVSFNETAKSLILNVRDYGPGIDPKLLEKVFEPYYRVHPNDANGSGLGLTIARSIARTHGGDLQIKNHSQGGLEVSIQLSKEL